MICKSVLHMTFSLSCTHFTHERWLVYGTKGPLSPPGTARETADLESTVLVLHLLAAAYSLQNATAGVVRDPSPTPATGTLTIG
jgi:hypothetical protein